jgi:antirestriction protein ArdC
MGARLAGKPHNEPCLKKGIRGGTNVLLLWTAAARKGYRSPYWLTFKQAGELQGKVKKGEKAAWIVYAATQTRKDEKGEEVEYRFLKWYFVFNVSRLKEFLVPNGRR